MTTQYDLTQDEKRIIDVYRKINAQGKDHIQKVIYCIEDYPPFQKPVLKIVRGNGKIRAGENPN